jgi:hypothetical protein
MLPEWVTGIGNESLFTSGAHLSSKPSVYGRLWSNKVIYLHLVELGLDDEDVKK